MVNFTITLTPYATYLSPRWGYGTCAEDAAIHIPPRWGCLSGI